VRRCGKGEMRAEPSPTQSVRSNQFGRAKS
jgi:hypothetical protein